MKTSISITDLTPAKELTAPRAATHVGFTAALGTFNFEDLSTASLSDEIILSLNNNPVDIFLTTPIADLSGTQLLALKIVFYNEINGELYLLNENKYCPIEIVDVADTNTQQHTWVSETQDQILENTAPPTYSTTNSPPLLSATYYTSKRPIFKPPQQSSPQGIHQHYLKMDGFSKTPQKPFNQTLSSA